MPIDWQRALERAEELKAQGYSDSQVSAVLDQEAAAADRAAQAYGHESAKAARSTLQAARGNLNADAASPGEEPDADPVERAFKMADESGAQRGSDARMQAYLDGVFAAAQRGDARVVHEGVMTDEVRRRWHKDAPDASSPTATPRGCGAGDPHPPRRPARR
jgi:hypothetical protein